MASKIRYIGFCGLLACLVVLRVFAADQVKGDNKVGQLKQEELDKISEAFGHMIGRNLSAPGIEFDTEKVIAGIRAATQGKPSPLSDTDYEEFMGLIQQRAFQKIAEENLSQAEAVIERNKQDKQIVELQDGKLQYKILKKGDGAAVTRSSTPVVHYTGSYADGSVFASSADSGGPISIPLEQTIPGFSEGIVGMREGEKREIIIHPDLGYGTSGHLPPNSLLVFEVELVKADSSTLAAPIAVPSGTADATSCVDCTEASSPEISTANTEAAAQVTDGALCDEAMEDLTQTATSTTELAGEAIESDTEEALSAVGEQKAPTMERTSLAQTDAGGSSLAERITMPSDTAISDAIEEQQEAGHTAEPTEEGEEQAPPLPACA